jgi:hypothetical protein
MRLQTCPGILPSSLKLLPYGFRVALDASACLLGTTMLGGSLKFTVLGYLDASSSIFGINSPIRKGFETTSSMPAAKRVAICSLRALAVTAMIGMWHRKSPAFSISLILLVHCRPSITGISLSIRTTPRSTAPLGAFFQYVEFFSVSRASPPWLATCVAIP